MNKSRKLVLHATFMLAAVFASGDAYSYALDFGSAGEFNVFVLGDMTAANSDIEGRLAVGGNLSLDNYSIGMKLSNSLGTRDDLVAGGNLNLTNSRIYNGNARSGGIANIAETAGFYSDDDPNRPNGSYIAGNPIDFTSVAQELIAKSSAWSALSTNGSQTSLDEWGNLKLTGYDTNFNVFSVSASDLAITTSFWIDVPDNAKTLVNISGTDVSMSNFGFFRSDANGERVQVKDNGQDSFFTQAVIFNLFGATTLNLNAIGIEGSLLAPLANTEFYNGQINGNLILGSLNLVPGQYTGEAHNVPFLTAQVPAPAVGWILLFFVPLMRQKRCASIVSRER
ncbi:choice-of-anchor A family protein [Methylomonas sp. MgM2]